MKQDLHRLDQYQATLMMEEPPIPPIEVIFQPSMAMVQAVKIQPRTVSRKAQIWTTRIFISKVGLESWTTRLNPTLASGKRWATFWRKKTLLFLIQTGDEEVAARLHREGVVAEFQGSESQRSLGFPWGHSRVRLPQHLSQVTTLFSNCCVKGRRCICIAPVVQSKISTLTIDLRSNLLEMLRRS